MGLFVARISRGRTIKQMVTGSVFFGSFGCAAYFIILGNFGLSLQLSGQLDVVQVLNTYGANTAIFSILEQLPFSGLIIFLFTALCIIFTATTFDSISFILASVVQNNVTEDPMRWNRLFWAFVLSLIPSVLMFLGGLETLQTAAIVGGVPLLVIAVMLMISAVKATLLDLSQQKDFEDPTINIETLPHIDPWSKEGSALGRFEQLRDQATEAAREEREALDAVHSLKKQIRIEPSHRGMADLELGEAPAHLLEALEQLTEQAMKAKKTKQDASEKAQEARQAFNELIQQRQLQVQEQEVDRVKAAILGRLGKA